jgi:outer membrane protein assembly factor BamB
MFLRPDTPFRDGVEPSRDAPKGAGESGLCIPIELRKDLMMRTDLRVWRTLPSALFILSFAFALPALHAEHWGSWRGPNDDGMAEGDAPAQWSDTENVKWRVEIPGRGHSSPVVWGDRIFVTTAIPVGDAPPPAEPEGERRGGGGAGPLVDHHFDVLCMDRNSGKLLWQKTAAVAKPHEGYHRQYGSFASNSPVTDGEHVFAFFGSRGVYAYDFAGNLKWKKDFGVQMKMHLAFGEGIAAVLEGGTLLLTYDHSGDSFLVALNKNTGEELWRAARDEISNWAAPLVVEHGGRKQVVVAATKKVRSYDFETGKLIWESAGLGMNTIPAPVQQGDLVYVMSGYRDPNLMAIRLGRTGDLTGTDAIVWSETRGTSYTPSPVLHDGKLYTLTDRGMLSCFNAATGEPYYHQARLPGPHTFKASPVGAAGKLYLASEEGDVIVVRMGPEFEVIATNTLRDQVFIASPAIVDGEIFLRGQSTLFSISEKK